MGFRFSPKIVTDGLVFYVDAANTKSYVSGSTTWNDLTENNNNGTLTNGPTFDSSNLGSIVFDGSNDYVDYENLNISYYSIEWSVSSWFKIDASSVQNTIVGYGDGNIPPYYYWLLKVDNTNVISFWAFNGANREIIGTTNIELDTWYNICATYETGGSVTLYLNGQYETSGTSITANNVNATYTRVGYRHWNTQGGYFNGNVANVKIYNRSLSNNEILQNYNALKSRFGL